jgi:predicted GNAT superfamily acetyltransferase
MVDAYWNVGRIIVEAQGGNEKAEYGQALLKNLSGQLRAEFGKGFDVTNLGRMKRFYLTFKNIDALRHMIFGVPLTGLYE